MIGSILKMNWQKELLLKTLHHFYVSMQQLYLRKSEPTGFPIGITREIFIIQRTFVSIVIIAKRQLLAERSLFAALSVPLAPNALSYLLYNSGCLSYIINVLFPFKYLIKSEILNFSGIAMLKCI